LTQIDYLNPEDRANYDKIKS